MSLLYDLEKNVFRLKSLCATAALAAIAFAGVAVEANAQDRSLWLSTGGAETVEGSFFSGETIYGSCDGDCYDLDLALFDSNGNIVSQDTAGDAAPVVVAPYDGYFYVQVSMPNCSHPGGCAAWVSSDNGF
ncbi:MAG: hypothetical protein AAGM36_00970 [Cyanobacteria bacterium J06597_1]